MDCKLYKIIISVLVAISFLQSCRDRVNSEPEKVLPGRTLIVYMGGDNNLSVETYEKLHQLAKGWDSSFDGELLIYQDTPWNDSPRLLKITGYNDETKNAIYDVIHKYEKSNSADPSVFRRAIYDAMDACPAKSYGLIVFSHASGWLPPHTLSNPTYTPRSIIIDNDDEMDIKDFAAIALPDRLFNFIILEACNMANVEVAYELKDKADYIIASSAPIVSPGFTNIYASNIKYLFQESPDLKTFSQSYFDLWNSYSGNKQSATISLIKTSELTSLAEIIKSIRSNNSEISFSELQTYDGSLQSPYYFFDFEQYYSFLANQEQLQALRLALDKCIIYKANTVNYTVGDQSGSNVFPISIHSGLTTYIEQDKLVSLNNEYHKLKWYSAISTK